MPNQDGFRQGAAEGLDKSRQEAFNQGLRDGFLAGVAWGRAVGELRWTQCLILYRVRFLIHLSKLLFNSALRTSGRVNSGELAQIREDVQKAKSERLLQLASGPTSHTHPRGQASNAVAANSSSTPSLPTSLETVHSRIDSLKARVARIQGATPTDKFWRTSYAITTFLPVFIVSFYLYAYHTWLLGSQIFLGFRFSLPEVLDSQCILQTPCTAVQVKECKFYANFLLTLTTVVMLSQPQLTVSLVSSKHDNKEQKHPLIWFLAKKKNNKTQNRANESPGQTTKRTKYVWFS